MMFAMALLYVTFITLRHFSSIGNLLRVFIMKGYWILSNAFSAAIETICGFCTSFCYYGISYLLIYICWRILASQG
jgi:hypothetical protein